MALDPRTWTDEQAAIAVAVAVIAVVSVAGSLLEVPFGARTAVAVLAGFVALVLANYLLTGSPLPPSLEDTGER